MKSQFPLLLSPVRIGKTVLKNRLYYPNASPHFLQGPESFPSEGFRTFYTTLAREGLAVITLAEWNDEGQRNGPRDMDFTHMQSFDLKDPSVENYLCQLADEIHLFGSKLCLEARVSIPRGFSFGGGKIRSGPPGTPLGESKKLEQEEIDQIISGFVENVAHYHALGYDMLSIRFEDMLQPSYYGDRQDAYNASSIEGRSKFILDLFAAVKQRMGPDFLTTGVIRGERYKGYTLEDVVGFAKLAEGKIDILELRDMNRA